MTRQSLACCLGENDVGFRFDLKSAYHHIGISEGHRTFLGFNWQSRCYVFNVLPFGISSAAYIFTKVLRHPVKHWRAKGFRLVLYLDDGFVVSESRESAVITANIVRTDLIDFGFLIAEEKSDWTPKPVVTWLGHVFDFQSCTVHLTESRLHKTVQKCLSLLDRSNKSSGIVPVRLLASVVGSVQSSAGAVGSLAYLMTKFCHMCLETRRSWYSSVGLTDGAKSELKFWADELRSRNGQRFRPEIKAFSDASDTGYGGFLSGDVNQNSSGRWTDSESGKSSTWREIEAINRLLDSFSSKLRGRSVQWNIDNNNMYRIFCPVAA